MTSERKQRILAPAAPVKDPAPRVSSRKVSTACSNCRLKKARCSGTAPCNSCVKHDLECNIDEATDSRRKIHLKRKIDSLEGDRDLFVQVLEILRNGGVTRVHSLLQLIRSNASLEELQLFCEDKLNATSTLDSTVDEVRLSDEFVVKIPRRVLNIKRLADQPVFRAYSDFAEAYEVPNDPSTRGLHFYKEAKRCFEQEDGHSTIATVQGLAVLSTWYDPFVFQLLYDLEVLMMRFSACLMGKDRRGWIYQGQLAYAAKELECTLRTVSSGSLTEASDIRRVIELTLWGLYNMTIASAFAYQKPPLIEKPSRPCPPSTHDNDDPLWHPYPHDNDGLQAHYMCYFHSLSDLTAIVDDWCTLLFDGFTKPPPNEIQDMEIKVRKRLAVWEKSLRTCLRIETGRVILPHVLCLHMYYHNICITISELAKAAEHGAENQHRGPQESSLSSARHIAGLMELHRSSWGIDMFPACYIHWIAVSMFTLMGQLDVLANQEAFINLCVAAKVASRRWPLARGTLRTVQITAKRLGVKLPPETDTLFLDFEKEIWGPKGRNGLSSLYPNFAVLTGSLRNEAVEMDKFLEKEDSLEALDLAEDDEMIS
ncbi:C6 transcription factor [Aspergillus niger]|nr:C6 transcription factor [Aspergillus niger]